MRLLRCARLSLAIVPALLATAASGLPAQTVAPAPATRSLSFDVAAVAKDRIRASVEAFRLGRFTVGVTASYSHRIDSGLPGWPSPLPYYRNGTLPALYDPMPCYEPFSGPMRCVYPYYADTPRYRAWSVDLAARYYPSALSFANGDTKMMVYVGEFVGYHWRTWDESVMYYGGVLDGPYMAPRDTVIPPPGPDTLIYPPNPYPILPGPNPIRHTLQGLQPGIEIGVRLLPFGKLFVEVGGRFTLVTVDDPWRRAKPGDVETRLVVAGGLAW